jgi:hypothetical protein
MRKHVQNGDQRKKKKKRGINLGVGLKSTQLAALAKRKLRKFVDVEEEERNYSSSFRFVRNFALQRNRHHKIPPLDSSIELVINGFMVDKFRKRKN